MAGMILEEDTAPREKRPFLLERIFTEREKNLSFGKFSENSSSPMGLIIVIITRGGGRFCYQFRFLY